MPCSCLTFFFYSYRDHQSLHSFPTRRSSDLTGDPVPAGGATRGEHPQGRRVPEQPGPGDRKSTRLNSSHVAISYAVFCLKKKNSIIVVGFRSAREKYQ